MKQKNVNHLFLWFTKLTGGLPAWLYLRPQVFYADPKVQKRKLPKGSILMSNHKSLIDFVVYLIVFFWQTIRFQMAEVLFNKGKLFANMLFGWGGIYVNRDTYDFSFIAESIKILDKGGKVGVFPQGRLPVGEKEWPFKPSVVYIALKSGAPIIPVYTDGNYGFGKRAHVIIGTPLQLCDYFQGDEPDKEQLSYLLGILEEKNRELKKTLEERLSGEKS